MLPAATHAPVAYFVDLTAVASAAHLKHYQLSSLADAIGDNADAEDHNKTDQDKD